MADIVQANYESLAAVAKQFAQQSNKIHQMHGRLNRQVALLRPTWDGKGSEAFFAEMADKVMPAVQRLGAALADADRVTRQIEEILHGAEEQGSSPFQQDEEPIFRALPHDPGADLGGAGGSDEGTGGAGGESGGADDGPVGEPEGGQSGPDQGLGGESGGTDGGGVGTEFVRDPEDFGQDFSIDNLSSGSGGAWGDDSFQPFDTNDPLPDQLYKDYGFDTTGDFGGDEAGSLGPGGDSSYTVPDDWLSEVEKTLGSPWTDDLGQDTGGAGGSGGGGDAGSGGDMGGGASGGGGESSGGASGGSTGSGGAPLSSASPAGGMGQAPAATMPVAQGSSMGASSQGATAALPAALRYSAIGVSGAGIRAVTGAETPGSSAFGAGVAAAAPQAAQANVGVPMGLAALAPLLALVGKAVKDRSSDR